MNKRYELNKELAQMLKGGVIMDVNSKFFTLISIFEQLALKLYRQLCLLSLINKLHSTQTPPYKTYYKRVFANFYK